MTETERNRETLPELTDDVTRDPLLERLDAELARAREADEQITRWLYGEDL